MNRNQRIVIGIGAIIIAAMLFWVPYKATYKFKDSQLTADAGYETVFTPPGADVCRYSLELYANASLNTFDPSRCQISIDGHRMTMTIAAAILALLALFITFGATRERASSQPGEKNVKIPKREVPATVSGVGRRLLSIDPSLPIGSGDLTVNSPLVITCESNYVPVEYRIMNFIHADMKDVEAEFTMQGISIRGDRKIDELDFRYRKVGEKDWGEKVTYYFDITTGANAASMRASRRWWEVWK